MSEKRSSGILLHITSLPSSFGIGDMGPAATQFADFLYRSRQQYWQVLPLTPVQAEQGFSPYSSASGMAGNTLLISPELLYQEGLLSEPDLSAARFPPSADVDFPKVAIQKKELLKKAYQQFRSNKQEAFEAFIHREAYWLDDFVLYTLLKEHFQDKPWHQWPDPFRHRDLKTLMQFTTDHHEALHQAKWFQFIFFRQWKFLKNYCHDLNIRILGDLPFYISHDSVDAWSHPELFAFAANGEMTSVAGVPPDYFNKDGQRWGMPIYRWDVLKEQRYDWWIKRIRRNLELVDVLRLDHFRAFSEFWEVPASAKTARDGQWRPGPGTAFFTVLQQEFGKLPFVAEDLGDIGPEVHRLREQFNLPGMKVVQFAFGKNMPESDHIPHHFTENFFAYTGTHDNNTTAGWFRNELPKKFRQQVSDYTGQTVTEENVHRVLGQLIQASVAQAAILPMQDVLGLNEHARMNVPASVSKNWQWRLIPGQLSESHEAMLRTWAERYDRI